MSRNEIGPQPAGARARDADGAASEKTGRGVDGTNGTDPGRPPGRFSTLPTRIQFEDMVEEVAAEDRAPDNAPDPNREVAWKYGLGI